MTILDKQINEFKKIGYSFINGYNKEKILKLFESQYTNLEGNLEELFFNPLKLPINVHYNLYTPLYYYLGKCDEENQYVTDNCIWCDLEFFDIDGKTEYEIFMKRMGIISSGELTFEKINCYRVQNGLDNQANIEFEVNGIKKLWNIKYGYQDVFIQRFALLCEELNTKGKYTIYDDGGQQFVLDYGTEEEVKKFNEVTGLERKFLKDTNHFGRPTD